MRELSEPLRNTIIAAIPTANLVLCYAPLRGTSPTIADRVLAANDGTFTTPLWKTLRNGLVVPRFAGASYIKNATANWRSGDSQGAIIVFARFLLAASSGTLFASSDELAYNRYIRFCKDVNSAIYIEQRNADTADTIRGSTVLVGGKWYSCAVTSDGSAYSLLVDGVAETLTVSSGANTGDWFADTANRDNFSIGAYILAAFFGWLTAQVGLVLVYSVAPSVAQLLQMHNRLKGVFH